MYAFTKSHIKSDETSRRNKDHALNNRKAGANKGYLGYSLMLFVLYSGSNQRINTLKGPSMLACVESETGRG